MYREIEACRVCGNRELVEVLDLGIQALTGVFPRENERVEEAPLRLVKCSAGPQSCGLLQLRHSCEPSRMYGGNYGYRSGLNATMVAHLQTKVGNIIQRFPLKRGSLVIDIGSNDATTLRAFPEGDFTLVGVDPSAMKFVDFYPPHVSLIPEFFSADRIKQHYGSQGATVITSFAMFYDVEEPLAFMRDVRELLADDGIWVFEQSYMPAMLDSNSYDTVCHEHLEYYSLEQIAWMTERVGMKIVDVEFNEMNGGSFSVIAAKKESIMDVAPGVQNALERESKLALADLETYRAFARRTADSRTALRDFVATARSDGKTVGILGASTKGNVMLQYCGITPEDATFVGDVNPDKYGRFTPGSGLPIRSEDELLDTNPDYLVVLPWHFRSFFETSVKFAGRTLVFPLPDLELVHVPPRARVEEMRL